MYVVDIIAAVVFALAWLTYDTTLKLAARPKGAINADMILVRQAWVRRMLKRDNRIADSTLLGHLLNSATFFASTNLLVIAAAAGVLFGGEETLGAIAGLAIVAPAPGWLMEAKVALVALMLARGLLDFIWAIRQLNYCSALMGAAPEPGEVEAHEGFAQAMSNVLNPAFGAFNKGVRAYYFALAAGAWIISPWAMGIGAVAAYALLLFRQLGSPASQGVRAAKNILQSEAGRAPKD